MPKRITGVSARLLEVAKQEFTEKGYMDASLRNIAALANTSPRAIYTRFKNKEDLFGAIVEPVYTEFMERFRQDKAEYWSLAKQLSEETLSIDDIKTAPSDYYVLYLDYAYEHKDIFILLLTKSSGTKYENFTNVIAEVDYQTVLEHNPLSSSDDATLLFLKCISYSFYNNLFTPLLEQMSLDNAHAYIQKLSDFYTIGLQGLMR